MLLKAGADTEATLLASRVKAIDCAQANGHDAVVEYLNNPALVNEEAALSKEVSGILQLKR